MLLHTEFVNYGGGFFVAFPCAVGFALGTHPPKELSLIHISEPTRPS